MTAALFNAVDGAVVIRVHVQPGARRSAVVGRHGDALKVKVAAPPVDDRANAAVRALMASLFDVPIGRVTLVSGAASRSKRVRIEGIDESIAEARLGEAMA
jgi:uncharacterized protein (TIGR00251 family)